MALFLGLLGGLSSQHNNTWPSEKGPLRSLESEWTCAAVGQNEWPQVPQLIQTMLCRHRATHMYTNTSMHTHTYAHKKHT